MVKLPLTMVEGWLMLNGHHGEGWLMLNGSIMVDHEEMVTSP